MSSSDSPGPAASMRSFPSSRDRSIRPKVRLASRHAPRTSAGGTCSPILDQRERALRVFFTATVRDALPCPSGRRRRRRRSGPGNRGVAATGPVPLEPVAEASRPPRRCSACCAPRPADYLCLPGLRRDRRAVPPHVPALELGDARHPARRVGPRDRDPTKGARPSPAPTGRPPLLPDHGEARGTSASTSGSASQW